MEEPHVLGRDEDRIFQMVVGGYDVPAYVRRAQRVQGALDDLLARCRRQRDEWLEPVRARLGVVFGLAGDERRLLPYLTDEGQLTTLCQLRDELRPAPRVPVGRTRWGWRLRAALRDLRDAVEGFNRRWEAYLPAVDLAEVNAARAGYNRWYVLEKECALRSARLARLGFRPKDPFTHAELAALLPGLPTFGMR